MGHPTVFQNGVKGTLVGPNILIEADVDGTTIIISGGKLVAIGGGGSGGPAVIVPKAVDYTILAGDTGKRFIGAVNFTLPPAVALPGSGIPFEVGFIVPNGGTLTVIAGTGDEIQYGALNTPAAGYVQSSTFGTLFWLVNIGVNQWVVDRHSGSPLGVST